MKQYRVSISDEALEEIEKHLNYITDQSGSREVATRWWSKAMREIDSLDQMPSRCPLAPEDAMSSRTIRMLIVDSCLFLFAVYEEDAIVRVLRFRHGSREPWPVE